MFTIDFTDTSKYDTWVFCYWVGSEQTIRTMTINASSSGEALSEFTNKMGGKTDTVLFVMTKKHGSGFLIPKKKENYDE